MIRKGMFSILCLLIIFCGSGCDHQQSAEVIQRAKDSIRYIEETKYLIKSMPNRDSLHDFILLNKMCAFFDRGPLDKLIADSNSLPVLERAFVKEEIFKPFILNWNIAIVPTAHIITHKTIDSVFNKNLDGWFYFYKHFGLSYEAYSQPVFFKNYSYCVIYTEDYCGNLCGGGDWITLKKENGIWKIVNEEGTWVS